MKLLLIAVGIAALSSTAAASGLSKCFNIDGTYVSESGSVKTNRQYLKDGIDILEMEEGKLVFVLDGKRHSSHVFFHYVASCTDENTIEASAEGMGYQRSIVIRRTPHGYTYESNDPRHPNGEFFRQ